VHAAHCCEHGPCKYGDTDCPVLQEHTKGLYGVEDCRACQSAINWKKVKPDRWQLLVKDVLGCVYGTDQDCRTCTITEMEPDRWKCVYWDGCADWHRGDWVSGFENAKRACEILIP
jgi:hypothetical protein